MNWNEVHSLALERIKEQPRGFQARLAERLGVTTASVAQWVGGGRPIPTDRIHEVLEMLGLELNVQLSSKDGGKHDS